MDFCSYSKILAIPWTLGHILIYWFAQPIIGQHNHMLEGVIIEDNYTNQLVVVSTNKLYDTKVQRTGWDNQNFFSVWKLPSHVKLQNPEPEFSKEVSKTVTKKNQLEIPLTDLKQI